MSPRQGADEGLDSAEEPQIFEHKDPTPAGTRTFRGRLWGKVVLVGAPVVAVLLFIAAMFEGFYEPIKDLLGTRGEVAQVDPSAQGSPASPRAENASEAAPQSVDEVPSAVPAGAAPAIGDCLTDPADLSSIVACDAEHSAEVIAGSGDCSEATAVRYAGGAEGKDFFNTAVEARTVGDACVLSLKGTQAQVSFRDVLASDAGEMMRECWNGDTMTLVPCSKKHTGEIVARVPANFTNTLDCKAEASEYMGQNISERLFELEFGEVPPDTERRCVVSARSDTAWLSTPLRAIGNGEIETQPM